MTKNQIKAALDLAGVTYAKKANLETLQALYAEHVGQLDTDGTPITPEQVAALEGTTAPAIVQPEEEAPAAPEAAPEQPTGTGLKIEKDRPEQNGIKRPSAGGKCRAIWDALDSFRAETGELPTSKTVKELATDEGWNPNNASIEYYQWRKFNGIAKGA